MLAHLKVVSGNGVPHPLRPMFLLRLHGIDGVRHSALGDRIGENALLLLCIIQTKSGTDVEILEGVDIDVGIAEHAPITVAIVGITLQSCHGVFAVRITTHRTCIVATDSTDRDGWVELQHILQESSRCLHFAGAVDREVLADGDDVSVAQLQQFVVRIHAGRKTLEVGVLDDTVILIIS